MQAIGSARPGLISSLLRLSRYSTESLLAKGRLATEWDGIAIPSRQEVHEREQAKMREAEEAKEARKQEATRRKAEAYKADISYLENAPEKSLAGRLARAEPRAQVKPPSREDIQALTQRRREERLAREAERAKTLMREATPSPEMLKVISAAKESTPPRPRITQDDFFANFTPKQNDERRHPRQEQVRVQPPHSQIDEGLSHQAVLSEVEEKPADAKADDGMELFQFSDLNEKVAKAAEEEEKSEDGKKAIKETIPLSQRELETSLAAKRREERLRRKERVFARDLPDEAAEAHPSLSASRREALAASIAKRREQRLRRERQKAEALVVQRDPKDYSLDERDSEGRRRGPNLRQAAIVSASEDLEDLEEISPDEDDTVLPEFTGPEPVSTTLSEIIGYNRPPVTLSNLSKSGKYTNYLSPHLKFSTPPDKLHPVHLAQLTLSRRAGLSLPQRRHAIDIITQAFQPRSSRPSAKA